MRKFTKVWQWMLVLIVSSSIVIGQAYAQGDLSHKQKEMAQKSTTNSFVENVQLQSLTATNGMAQQQITRVKTGPDYEKHAKAGSIVPASDFLFDLQFEWDLVNPDGLSVGIETDGNYIYTCHWQNSTIYRYDMDGNFVNSFDIGVALTRDLAYNPNNGYFYGAAAGTTVSEMDFTFGAEALVRTFTAPTAIRAIGYDSDNDLLFGNNWGTDVNFFDLTGTFSYSFPVGPYGDSYYGFAYDNYSAGGPYIWGYAQVSATGLYPLETLVQMDMAGNETGVTFDVGAFLGHDPAAQTLAGGLAITPPGTFPSVAPGEWSIFGITQNTFMWALELGAPNPCSSPVGVNASNVTQNTADIDWTETGTSTAWEVEYGLAGFTQGTGTTIMTGAHPITLTGLSALTAYDVYVRSDCGGGSYSGWSAVYTFSTSGGDCDWSCIGYDSYGDGWNGGSIDFVVNGSPVANWGGPATTGPETFYFPIIDGGTLDLVWNPGSWDSEVTYEIYDGDGVLVFSEGPNPVGTTGIGLYCPGGCQPPQNVGVTGLTGTEATLTWDDSNAVNLYDIVWGETGFDPNAGPFTGTAYGVAFGGAPYSYLLSGLTDGLTYDAYVRSDCGGGTLSGWAGTTFLSVLPPANDDCASAEYVGGPYPYTTTGTTIGATVDCPGVLDWNAVWYEVELPYASNNVYVDYCGTEDQYTIGIVYYDDCSDCNAYVIADAYQFVDCGTGFTTGEMNWQEVPGPTTIMFPAYTTVDAAGTPMDFTITFNVMEDVVCDIGACPPGATVDPEPPVYDGYVDTFNGGCNSSPEVYGSIACGETLCGTTGWFDGGNRDTDWYMLTLTDPTIVTAELLTEVETNLYFVLIPPTGCVDATVEYSLTVLECTSDVLTGTLDPALGDWCVWVGPSTFDGTGGDWDFHLTVDCAPIGNLDGTLTYFNNNTPLEGVNLDIAGTMVGTGVGGAYGPVAVPQGPVSIGVTNNPYGWSPFNILDIINFRQYLASGTPALTPIQLMAADVNWQGTMNPNILDVIVMRQELANLNPAQWTIEDWLYYDTDVVVGAMTTHDFNAIMAGDVNASNVPVSPVVLNEGFGTFPPTGWTVVNNGGDCEWNTNTFYGRTNNTGGAGDCAAADSDACGSGTTMDTDLFSPVISLAGYTSAELTYLMDMNYLGAAGEYASVDITTDGGATWTTLGYYDFDLTGPEVFDLTPYVGGDVQLRFRYVAPGWDWWFQVDDVKITAN